MQGIVQGITTRPDGVVRFMVDVPMEVAPDDLKAWLYQYVDVEKSSSKFKVHSSECINPVQSSKCRVHSKGRDTARMDSADVAAAIEMAVKKSRAGGRPDGDKKKERAGSAGKKQKK